MTTDSLLGIDPAVTVHPPFQRIHLAMILVTVTTGLAVGGLVAGLLLTPMSPNRRADATLGIGMTALIAIIGLAVYWIACLGHQRSAELRGDSIVVRSWIRVAGLGTDRTIDLTDVQHVLLLRPHHLEFTIPGAQTRSGTFWQTVQGKDRVGTFWWREDEYLAMRDALMVRSIPVEFRHVPGMGTLPSSR